MGAKCCGAGVQKTIEEQSQKLQKYTSETVRQVADGVNAMIPKARRVSSHRRGVAMSRKDDPDNYYTTKEKIGEGGFGTVYLAESKAGSECAIKRVPWEKVEDQLMFEQEVAIQAELDHPNVARILNVFDWKENTYIVTEACMGGELTDLLRDDQVLGEPECRAIMAQAMAAINYMHGEGFVHRDIKLDNFLLHHKPCDWPTTRNHVSLIDFGLSAKYSPGETKLKTKCGTPWYMAPEIIFEDTYNEKCDVWSLGVLMYMLLSGQAPFVGINDDDLSIFEDAKEGQLEFDDSVWKDVSGGAKFLIRQMIKTNVDRRFTTQQCLESFWIKKKEEENKTICQKAAQNKNWAHSFKDFSSQCKFKRQCMNLIAYHLDPDDLQDLRNIFVRLDKDDSGTLSLEEMESGLREVGQEVDVEHLRNSFKQIDIAESGQINYTEFIASTIDASSQAFKDHAKQAMREAFNRINVRGTGQISLAELTRFLSDSPNDQLAMKARAEELMLIAHKGHHEDELGLTYDDFLQLLKSPIDGRPGTVCNRKGHNANRFKMRKQEGRERIARVKAKLPLIVNGDAGTQSIPMNMRVTGGPKLLRASSTISDSGDVGTQSIPMNATQTCL
mmetsp:Transcript_160063/g.292181  ORF Transcript_160063/g.292181 Transcript_160063/m.292181 type:complete len:614 (-) Transcript_160063:102-1943(-)